MTKITTQPSWRSAVLTVLVCAAASWNCSKDSGATDDTTSDVGGKSDAVTEPDADQPDEDVRSGGDVAGESDGGDDQDTDSADTGSPPPGEWRLPEGYFVGAKMPMTVVHPRDGDAAAWAFCKNAHPGVRWEIPIVIQGGAWPFKYEIVDEGGAAGLRVGGELERSVEGEFVVHRVTPEYGVLWWDEPVEGTYDVLVRVHDQDGESIDVPVSLTVGTEGWIFVDGESGDDGNDGSRGAPFRTIDRIHAGGDEFVDHRVYLSGVVPMDGNRENGNLRVASDVPAPAVWVGLPDSDAVLEAYEGKFVLDAPDFYLANLEHRHHSDYAPDDGSFLHMITAWDDTDRFTVHDVHFSRFQGVGTNVGLGNSSIMMLTKNGAGRFHTAVVNNTLSGDNGILTSSYQLRYSVFEKNRAVGADFIIGDGSVWGQIYLKAGNNEFVTVRANEFWENNQYTNGFSPLAILQVRNVELAYNVLHAPWSSGRHGALKLWTNSPQSSYSWEADTPVWIYRNSLRHRVSYEGDALANMPDGTVVTQRNVLDAGAWPTSPRIVDDDNLSGDAYFDDQMRLTATARQDYLGRYGAEIAVPR